MAIAQYVAATEIRVGDKIAYDGKPVAVVMREPEPYIDPFGRTLSAFWCRAEDDPTREGWMPFGPKGVFPVIRANA